MKVILSILILFVWSTVSYSEEIEPTFSKLGPDAKTKFCAKQNYPVAWKYARDPCFRVGSFSNFDELLPTYTIRKKPPIWELTYADESEVDGRIDNLADEVLKAHPVTSLIIWRDGKVHKEAYQYSRKATDLFSSFSMHKTVTGLVIDVGIQRGLINSVDDFVTDYLPALNETAWQERTIFQALTMTTGISRSTREIYRELLFKDGDRLKQIVEAAKNPKARPGQDFEYSDTNTLVLGLISESVFGSNQGDIISDTIWQSVGAEADAQIHTTKGGQHLPAAHLRARARDFLRVGLLLVNEGKNHTGKQIIRQNWISSLFAEGDELRACPMGRMCREWPYSFHAWMSPIPNTIFAGGRYGQYIFVARETNTVIVITAADDPIGLEDKPAIMKLFRAVASKN